MRVLVQYRTGRKFHLFQHKYTQLCYTAQILGPRMPLKFCANLSFLFQETGSLLERYNQAKNAGFKAVECAFPYELSAEKVLSAKTGAGVEQILINAYPGNWSEGDRGLAAIPERKKEFEESITKSVEYAIKLDCKRIHIMSGVVQKEVPENLAVYTQNLRFAADIFKQNNIVGVIEPINPYAIPNYFLNSYQKAVTVIENINSEHLKLQLDFFHLQQICGNVTRNIEKLLPLVGHIQIAQVPNRNEPNTPGEIDYRYVLSLLENFDYSGWIGLEYIPKHGTREGLSWIKQLGYSL